MPNYICVSRGRAEVGPFPPNCPSNPPNGFNQGCYAGNLHNHNLSAPFANSHICFLISTQLLTHIQHHRNSQKIVTPNAALNKVVVQSKEKKERRRRGEEKQRGLVTGELHNCKQSFLPVPLFLILILFHFKERSNSFQ